MTYFEAARLEQRRTLDNGMKRSLLKGQYGKIMQIKPFVPVYESIKFLLSAKKRRRMTCLFLETGYESALDQLQQLLLKFPKAAFKTIFADGCNLFP